MGIREEVYYEGGPHIGDLIINILIGLTVIGLPLAVGAIVRAIWLRYRITNRRISVTGGWMGRDRSDIIYSEIVDIKKVPRGLGFWGDMVVTLRDGSRLELRAIPKFREIYDYISEKVAVKSAKTN
ncbi:PH domain-containing protein [Argonema antarcticum]|uniref:PH domain-containing protein n=1 Tax=Argonema antarcticum TaxID=2942763 RepID=UPI002010F28D|nr:PH domain-containing protein [Argonema antarcticum]MCL1469550.1 PH domain-containing protein [Argonema antarcticum A004/B2]